MKANGKITKELKALGLKINGVEPNGTTISELIKGIADDYEGETGGTTVVANPTLAGTEDPLTGLEVDGIKYKAVDTKYYRHNINIEVIYNELIIPLHLKYISSSNEPLLNLSSLDPLFCYTDIGETDLTDKYVYACSQTVAQTVASEITLKTFDANGYGSIIGSIENFEDIVVEL